MAAEKFSKALPDNLFDSREEKEETLRSIRNKANDEERRQIREHYRKVQDELTEQAQDLIKPSAENDILYEKLETVDRLFQPVKNTREAALDSASLVNISELGKKKALAIKTDFVRFNAADFCDKLRIRLSKTVKTESIGLSHENWVTLGRKVRPFFKCTPVLNFMYGSFERGEVVLKKKRTVREKEVDTDSSKSTKPTQLSSFENTDRGELTTAQVEHLLCTLWCVYESNEKNPICFFEFVTNPNSYGQTVENIFYASFLVRDGHARISLDNDEIPVIEPIQKGPSESTNESQSSQKQQVIVTLTPAEWRQIVNTFEIECPLIQPMKQKSSVLTESNPVNCLDDEPNPPYQGKGKGKGKKTDR